MGCTTDQRSVPLVSPSAAGSGSSGSLPIFSEISSVSTRDALGPADCASGLFIAEKVDEVGKKGLGNTKTINVETLLNALL
jgi:hypothetical protein